MSNIFNIGQIIVSIILIIAILMQQRGSGLSGVFGGEGNIYRTKRGLERFLFIATIVLAVLFIGSTMFRIIFRIQTSCKIIILLRFANFACKLFKTSSLYINIKLRRFSQFSLKIRESRDESYFAKGLAIKCSV